MINTLSLNSNPPRSTTNIRPVSFEPSNSWFKRFDDEGSKAIQAAWAEIGRSIVPIRADDSSIVITDSIRRVYGTRAINLKGYITPDRADKAKIAREAFTALLRASDHGRRLSVVVSHWLLEIAHEIAELIMGTYQATVNGHFIECEVVSVKPILEGFGTYHQMKCQQKLEPGQTLLLEFGHGTLEKWLFDEIGQLESGTTVDDLAVRHVVSRLTNHPILSDLAATKSRYFSPALVTAALRNGTPPSDKLDRSTWQAVRDQIVDEYWQEVSEYLRNNHSEILESAGNVVFTGGGAALLGDRIMPPILVPESPQIASVQGAYLSLIQ